MMTMICVLLLLLVSDLCRDASTTTTTTVIRRQSFDALTAADDVDELSSTGAPHYQRIITPHHPIASSSFTSNNPFYLDGNDWIATSSDGGLQIAATVPGDLITDLQNAGIIPDPYFELNWINKTYSNLWSNSSTLWTYQRNFTLPSTTSSSSLSSWLVVLDGIKMGAKIYINNHLLGTAQNQFLRYNFEIPSNVLKFTSGTNNTIEVVFDDSIDVEGRFMACTGGWDWAPYSYTSINGTTGPVSTFSKGIWKSVYLLEILTSRNVAIAHMTPHTKYLGQYPTTRLQDGYHRGFAVNVTVHLWTPSGRNSTGGYLEVYGSWGNSNSTSPLSLGEGDLTISLQLTAYAKDIQLWWPAGVGSQPLYNVTAIWHHASSHDEKPNDVTTTTTSRRVGFRVFALVTTNDTGITNITKARHPQQREGSGSHGMYFRVNGVPIYSRGANVVPMEELEGRMNGHAHRILVKSAVDANMNTLRVWGGGIFLPRDFYDACDEYGILIYHDMQYASNNGGPHGPNANSTSQENELRYQIRRLSHHPSIVIWDGVNEVVIGPDDPSDVFASFVMTVVAQEDQSRAIWPSSPASGWVTGVDTLYGTPLLGGEPLKTKGGGHIWDQGIETHAPYQLGSGWPAINGGDWDDCWDRWHLVHTPPVFNPNGTKFGIQQKNVYASEFGVSGSPSFESLSATLAKQHWGVHGGTSPDTCTGKCQTKRQCTQNNVMTQRNYACDSGIRLWMGNNSFVNELLNATGEEALKGQTYLCQLVQALDQKSAIEERRGKNQLGALVWMLNDIWPSISWGSLEYGSAVEYTEGQLLGGRWKPMHYFYKRSLFADIFATCGMRYHSVSSSDWICLVKNDRAGLTFSGTITLTAYNLMGNGTPEHFLQRHVRLPTGPGMVEWFQPTKPYAHNHTVIPNPNTTAVYCTIHDDENDDLLSEHLLTLTMPKNLQVPRARVWFQVSNTTNDNGTINIDVTSDRVALWVTLTSGANGRFSDNCFFLPATTKTVQFIPFFKSTTNPLKILQRTLRVEDFSRYMSHLSPVMSASGAMEFKNIQ